MTDEESLFRKKDIEDIESLMEIADFSEVITLTRTHINDVPVIHIDTIEESDTVIAILSGALQFAIMSSTHVCGHEIEDDEEEDDE